MQIVKRERNSNIELFRILVMLSIVAHHYVVNSGLLETIQQDSLSYRVIYCFIFGAWGKIGINGFVFITGYFMCTSQLTIQKYLKLFLEVCFYKFVITSIFVVSGFTSFAQIDVKTTIMSYLPVTSVKDSFISCILLFYLFIPFLNIMVRSMTQRQHFFLLCLLLGIYTGLGTLLVGMLTTNYVTWFCILYLIASYIRLYNPFKKVHWASIMGGAFFLSVTSVIILLYIGQSIGKSVKPYYFINDSYKILALVTGVSVFMFFNKLSIPQSSIINIVAKSCFGVLLIHANSDIMRQWLWKYTLDVTGHYYSNFFYIHSILSVIGIYIVCTLIDQLRIFCFEKPLFMWLEKKSVFDKWKNLLKIEQ